MDIRRVHILVSGRVQGVFYRANTQEVAQSLGVKGWVRNLRDGRVEVMAEGPEDRLKALVKACRSGSTYSRVEDLDVEYSEATGEFNGFSIRH